MIQPADTDIGRRVIYHPPRGHTVEEGTITSFNPSYVFVRYGADTSSKATPREHLCWTTENAEVPTRLPPGSPALRSRSRS